jgi:hypothetical protein
MSVTPTSTENFQPCPPASSTISDGEMNIFFSEPDCLQDSSNKKKCYYTIRYKQWLVKKDDYRINWYALGGGVLWMAYRKMYSYVLYYILASLIISTVSEMYLYPDLSFLLYFPVGFFGNSLYFTHATKSIQKIKQKKLDPSMEKQIIEKAGGTSITGMIICLVILILFVGV